MDDEDLRDLFAGLAMQGMMARQLPHDYAINAHYAYLMADAMIEAKYAIRNEGIVSAVKKRKPKAV